MPNIFRFPVRRFLDLPNVSIEVIEDSWQLSAKATERLFQILRQYRPRILHYMFTGFVGPFPWLAKACSVKKIFFTDQGSQPEDYTPRRSPERAN